ncbi:MAG: hypothetical protein KJO44_10895 [Gemmatimonadetes bacterium]|nr:hypothetical protein [Gemmatimonadota bacterium]
MAKQTLIDTACFVGESSNSIALDLSGYTNSVTFAQTVDEVDTTSLEDTARRRIASIYDTSFNYEAFDDDGGEPFQSLHDLHGSDAHFQWIESNSAMAEGDRGVACKVLESSYQRGGAHGDPRMLSISGNGDDTLSYTRVLQPDTEITSSGNSTGILDSITSPNSRFCRLWVLAATAGTIDVEIESATDSGFSVGLATRATFTQASGVGFQEVVAPPTRASYWRAKWTIATGPFTILVTIGDGPANN